MNFKYLAGILLSLPLLPLMYYHGKKIRANVPKLPEVEGLNGKFITNKRTKKSLKIIAIGESTTAGVDVKTHKEGFTGTVAKEISKLLNLNVSWKVYARSGYTAKIINNKIIPKIKETEADLIIMGLGGNDAFTLNSPSKWKFEIDTLIKSVKSKFPDSFIIFCNMPPIKEFPAFTSLIKFTIGNLVEVLGNELKEVVSYHKNVFYFAEKITFDSWIKKLDLKKKKEDFFSDGIHPSKLTYQTWGKEIAVKIHNNDKIKNTLKKRFIC